MTRKILVALVALVLMLPVTCLASANGRQYGIAVGPATASEVTTSGTTTANSILFSGLMSIDDVYIIQADFTALLNPEEFTTSPIPDRAGFGFGKIFGIDATKVNWFALGGLDAKTSESAFRAGPKAAIGLWIPIQKTIVFAFGPQLSYLFKTHTLPAETNYSLIAKFVIKLGDSSASSDMGAGGETPRGMFSAQ